MVIPRRASRPIAVDGVEYRWRIRQRPTYEQGAFGHPLNLAVESVNDAKCTLIVELAQAHPCNWLGDPAVAVTPRQVADHVRTALAAGWQPSEPSSAFRLKFTAAE